MQRSRRTAGANLFRDAYRLLMIVIIIICGHGGRWKTKFRASWRILGVDMHRCLGLRCRAGGVYHYEVGVAHQQELVALTRRILHDLYIVAFGGLMLRRLLRRRI